MAKVTLCDRCGETVKSDYPSYVKMRQGPEEIFASWELLNGIDADLCKEHYDFLLSMIKSWLNGDN